MTLQEKFDDIIELIEKLICAGEYDIPTITQTIGKKCGMDLRLLGDAFQFITDMTISRYIRQRRLVCALTSKVELGLPIEDIYEEAGYSDAAAFGKACKKQFGYSPGQITKTILAKHTPLFLGKIIQGTAEDQMESDTLATAKTNDMICGVSVEQFAEIKQVLELGAIYGLTDEEAEFVYRLATDCKITTSEAAEFYDDMKLQKENGSFLYEANLFELAVLTCKYKLSVSEGQSFIYEIRCHGYFSIYDLPDGFFDIYFHEYNERFWGYDVPFICEILDAMEGNGIPVHKVYDLLELAMTYGEDPVTIANNFQEYSDSWDGLVEDAIINGIPDDDTDGFGYRSIWELDES